MKLYYESVLRNQADAPTMRMLNLWHSLCNEKVGASIEVMVGNRRENPQFSAYPGELNTAIPQICGGKLVLSLFLDSLDKANSIIITHELGHWVLKLQGLKAILDKSNPHSNIEIMLNSLGQHPSLFKLQRTLGHEPQKEIDIRAAHSIAMLSKTAETSNEQKIENALLFSDDLINCSQSNRIGMKRILNRKHPNTEKLVNKILDIAGSKDLSKLEESLPFCQKVIQELKLGENWCGLDEINTLKIETSKLGK